MTLNHYTVEPFKFIKGRKYKHDPSHFKPTGLWLSDCSSNRGWKEWCEGEKWNTHALAHKTVFKCDVSDWFFLESAKDIANFTDEYRVRRGNFLVSSVDLDWIDWSRVMTDGKGIIITPYDYLARHKYMWYYGWDCASACVWDLKTVELICEKSFP